MAGLEELGRSFAGMSSIGAGSVVYREDTLAERDIGTTIGKILLLVNDPTMPQRNKLDYLNKLISIGRRLEDVSKYYPAEKLLQFLRQLVLDRSKALRAGAMRTIRYLCNTTQFLEEVMRLHIDTFLPASLDKDHRHSLERMQALKLFRRFMELDPYMAPRNCVQSLVANSENVEDSFQRLCLETLREMAVLNPELVSQCNGIRVIFNAILDPQFNDMSETLVLTILFLFNEEHTRKFLRPALDLQALVSPFTDIDVEKGPELEKRLASARRAIQTMLRSWTGVICLSSDEHGLRTLVQTLKHPGSDQKRACVFDTFYDILRIHKATSHKAIDRLPPVSTLAVNKDGSVSLPARKRRGHNLLKNYMSIVLLSFFHCGLVETLIDLGKGDNAEAAERATTLLGEILNLADSLLPQSHVARLHALPSLVNLAAFGDNGPLTVRASAMLTHLHNYALTKKKNAFGPSGDFHAALLVTGANKWRRRKGADRGKDRIETMKLKVDRAIEDVQFITMIKESQVVVTKDFMKWRWDIINELMEGPLCNKARLLEACNKHKFIKRLLSFYKPLKGFFCNIPWERESVKYVKTGCCLIELLVSTEDAAEFLVNSKLLEEIAEMLQIELSPDPSASPHRILTPKRVAETMAREYFTMIGTLSSSLRGIDFLHRMKMTMFYSLSQMEHREDLSKLLLTSLDYNMEGDARGIFSAAMTCSVPGIRLHCTNHLRNLLRAGVPDFPIFGMELLVTQLLDPDHEVVEAAMKVLEEACQDDECLRELVRMRPNILSMGEATDIKNVLLRIMGTQEGFEFLGDSGWAKTEIIAWKDKENHVYVSRVENALALALNSAEANPEDAVMCFGGQYGNSLLADSNFVTLPPHFYGELCKTKDGCALLRSSGHFEEFIRVIQVDTTQPLARRAALWAVGHIGSSELGFEFVKETDVLNVMTEMAQTSPVLSLRGTCSYVLGLLSRNERAREMLDALGWDFPSDMNATIAVPKDPTKFFQVPAYSFSGSWADHSPRYAFDNYSDTRREIVKTICDLSNHVIQKTAFQTLTRLKQSYPTFFTSPFLLFDVYHLLEMYHFRLPVRRYLHDLFDGVEFASDFLAGLDTAHPS